METEKHYHIEETVEDGIVTGTMVEDTDPWQAEEIDQLRADLEEAEVRADLADETAEKWYGKWEMDKLTLKQAVQEAQRQASELNLHLRDKMMIYLDLVNEYEKALDTYVVHTGVKLTTNNLKRILELKAKGDIIPT
jgi:hypothetical protein